MYKIGTRESKLALWQANFVKKWLDSNSIESRIVTIKTQGDIIQNLSFEKMEGKGFFTKEIERALINNQIDIAVHSLKDLPTEIVKNTTIPAITQFEDRRDLLLIRHNSFNKDDQSFFKLKEQAVLGTSSLRRRAQSLFYRPDLNIKPLRGNITTRVKKLLKGEYDAIILANIGIERLKITFDHNKIINNVLDSFDFLTSIGQGSLALQVRSDNKVLINLLKGVDHCESHSIALSERSMLNKLNGGCHIPLGVRTRIIDEQVNIFARVFSLDGQKYLEVNEKGKDPIHVGKMAAIKLIQNGCYELMGEKG